MRILDNVGTYIRCWPDPKSRRLLNIYIQKLGKKLAVPMQFHKLHCTLMCSKDNIEDLKLNLGWRPATRYTATIEEAMILGSYLVLKLESEELTERHNFWKNYGLTQLYANPEFIPHISLGKMSQPEFERLNIAEVLEPLIGQTLSFSNEDFENLSN